MFQCLGTESFHDQDDYSDVLQGQSWMHYWLQLAKRVGLDNKWTRQLIGSGESRNREAKAESSAKHQARNAKYEMGEVHWREGRVKRAIDAYKEAANVGHPGAQRALALIPGALPESQVITYLYFSGK